MKCANLHLFLLLWLVAASVTGSAQAAFRVTAYLPDYRLATLSPDAVNGVTDLIFFSLTPTPTGDLDSTHLPPPVLQKLHDLVKGKPTRLMVALGGWNLSANFAPMISSDTARFHFVQTLTKFCLASKLDGADFDWEQPQNPAEEQGYAKLLTEVKKSFAPHKLRLTVAVRPEQRLTPAAWQAVDAVHLMAYDHDGQHATEIQAEHDLQMTVGWGVPKKKILLGLPFYGRSVKDRNLARTYAEIVQQYHPDSQTDLAGDFYFNNSATIQQKTRYARKNGYGGVMIWEIGQDVSGEASLLGAVQRVLEAK